MTQRGWIDATDHTKIIRPIVRLSVLSLLGSDDQHDVIVLLRRTLPRFIGTVCVALALEGLIMVIKYSQMDMAGNLIYPVGIIASAGVLLLSLSFFLKYVPKP